MGNELIVFQNENFGFIRTIQKDGEVWFVAADVCNALDIGNPSQAITRLDDDERMTTLISNESAVTGKSYLSFVNEPGLYSLVLGSRKPEAKQFKRWITHEVIPAIRKTGSYSVEHKKEITIDLDTLKVIVGTSVAETVTSDSEYISGKANQKAECFRR